MLLLYIEWKVAPECGEVAFADVENNQWYSKSIAWAEKNKIVNGVGNNEFAPNANITREQIAVILYNYAKLCNYDVLKKGDLNAFNDTNKVSNWAIDSVKWAVGFNKREGKWNARSYRICNKSRICGNSSKIC